MSYVRSRRSMKYGIQPVPPSESAMRMSGNSLSTRLHNRSAAAAADVHRLQRDHDVDGGVGRGDGELAGRAEVDRQHGVRVDQCPPKRIPRVAVEGVIAEGRRVLGERQRMDALVREATDLGRTQLRVPQDREPHRDEPSRRGRAPHVDVPVVVGLQHRERQILVGRRREQPAGEPRERREAHRPEHAARVHVLHPLVDVVTTGSHLVERGRLDAVLLLRPPRDRVQPDVRDDGALEGPDIRAVGLTDDARRAITPLRRDGGVEHVRRLDEVVVDAHHDQVVGVDGRRAPLLLPVRTPDTLT